VIAVACSLANVAVWLVLGSRILLVIDRCFPGRRSPQATGPLVIDADSFALGSAGIKLPSSAAYQLILDSHGRLVLRADGGSFTLGPVQKMWTDPVKPQYLFLPERGDVVSFTRDVSRLSWQTPFSFRIMGGYMPVWHRYAYDRVRWTKDSGSILEITWREEQDFYPRSGDWQDAYKKSLTDISIHAGSIEKAAEDYLAGKGWHINEYRLETQVAASDDATVTAIHLKDEAGKQPGAGKSVVLRINKLSRKVTSETAFQ
jgi:hypothetical protein